MDNENQLIVRLARNAMTDGEEAIWIPIDAWDELVEEITAAREREIV